MARVVSRGLLTIYTNSVFYRHQTGFDHPERPERLDAAVEGVTRAGLASSLLRDVDVHPDTARIIAKVHSADYERELENAARSGYRYFHSLDNPISAATYAAARAAVATSIAAAEDIVQRRNGSRAFIIARPPGHHAERGEAMGFCFFNTIACVAEWLREQPGIERVFIFDFDVHHGNGTQHIFEERDDVFYASMHRYPFYPGTGAEDEIGEGKGRGFTKNIPMEAGEGDAAYLRATEDEIVRIIDDYQPHAILLSAGFDAHRRDPLGGMNVTEAAYGEITRRVVECAERWCGGRVVSLLEGGYDLEGLAASVSEHVHALTDEGRRQKAEGRRQND
ncbi:MAG TPA: histone deacetylase [Thermoanaerobaculia bacterium]|nr:histone deacetylase [Thermoanaerobaculia bacterium]